MIDICDIAHAAHAVLTTGGHEGKTYVLTGPESISFHDVSRGLSGALGKDVSYVDVPVEVGKEAYNVMAEFEAALRGKSYKSACRIVSSAFSSITCLRSSAIIVYYNSTKYSYQSKVIHRTYTQAAEATLSPSSSFIIRTP